MHADILTNSRNFNQLKMTRYTMTYDNIPKALFLKFLHEKCLDHSKCEKVKQGKTGNSNLEELEIEINVKNQNQNTGGFNMGNQNINEVFKFTCQRYHSYISQIIEDLKNKETQLLKSSGSAAKEEESEFVFMSSTVGLGSKCKGMPKLNDKNKDQGNKNVNQLDQIFLCEIFKLNRSKQELIVELSKNVDSSNVFEFLRLAANDSSNKETQHEAYWMIVYIFLKRTCGMDIVKSFSS